MEKNKEQNSDQSSETESLKTKLGTTLLENDEDGDSLMKSSPEVSYADENALEDEIEEDENELVERLETEKRTKFAQLFLYLAEHNEFWEEFKSNLFACGFIPHLFDIGHQQYIAIMPLSEEDLDDFKDAVDNSYAYIKFNN